MRKIITASFFLFTMAIGITSCKSTSSIRCIDESKIVDGPCTFEYAPVCGCDGKTYGNACMAERNGVTSWREGACADDLP